MKTEFDVVVIGAGVVGTACALGMAQRGFKVALIEAHTPAYWQAEKRDLRVYAFAPDNRKLCEDLGVWSKIDSMRAEPYQCMRVWDAAGGDELSFDASDYARSELGHIVEHNVLVTALWNACKQQNNLHIVAPDKIAAIEQDESGVRAELKSGQSMTAKVVIGADGAASKVRELVGIQSSLKDYAQRGLVAYLRSEFPHQHTAWQRFLSTGPLAFLPCSEGLSSIVWTLPNAEAERLQHCDAPQFEMELERAFDARLVKLELVSERASFPLQRQLASSMQQGRVLLMGDAAHAVHPLAGQGVNLGLRDVQAWLKSIEHTDWHQAHRIERWARSRYSENATATYAFETINQVFSNDAFLPTLLRGHVLGIAGKIPPLKRFFINEAAGW